jgi:hypothetical protein
MPPIAVTAFVTVNPVEANVIPLDPLIAKPIWLVAGKYKPVVVFPKKDNVGEATEPGFNTTDVGLDVLEVAL